MAGPNVFHVEFGINETELTRALLQFKYDKAKTLILDNAHTSYLDEGCYHNTPLYIVLGGEPDAQYIRLKEPRNFQIAKLLAQHGANVNLRIPRTCYGSEYMDPGRSALQMVVDFYDEVTLHPVLRNLHTDCFQLGWDPDCTHVLGLDGETITQEKELVNQLLDLAFILLAHGADTGLRDVHRATVLHHTAIHSADTRMLRLLTESGADLNALDAQAATPLCAMCMCLPYGVKRFKEQLGFEADPYTHCREGLKDKHEFLEVLLSHKDTKVDLADKHSRTPLFHCMLRGDMDAALILLQNECDPSVKGALRLYDHGTIMVSPLFASLCGCRVFKSVEEKLKALSFPKDPYTHFLAHLVDSGYFQHPAITEELQSHLSPSLQHLRRHGDRLLALMFGGTTCSLRQLCTRQLFQHYRRYFPLRTGDFRDMKTLVSLLSLPADSVEYFEIEFFRQELISEKLHNCHWFRLGEYDVFENFSDLSHSDEESTDSEADSDIEYW